MTRISVVIPVKDDREMLERCLAALRQQSRPADEIIVVDNDSADDSADLARGFGVTVVHEAARGIWAAAATGFDASTGDIIARLDADSVPPRDWVRRIERDFVLHPAAVAVSGRGRFYDLGPILRVAADLLYMRLFFVLGRIVLGNAAVFGSNFAMRATLWHQVRDRVHRADADVHDDIDLSYHIHPSQTVLFDRRLLVGISGRPFTDAGAMAVRWKRAAHTVAVHGFGESPVPRWLRRLRDQRTGSALAMRDRPQRG